MRFTAETRGCLKWKISPRANMKGGLLRYLQTETEGVYLARDLIKLFAGWREGGKGSL